MTPAQIAGIRGIGEALAQKIVDLLATKKLQILEDYILQTPPGILEMLKIKGLGPKKIITIWKELGIESIGELLYACEENRLINYKGFGAKTQQSIQDALNYYLGKKVGLKMLQWKIRGRQLVKQEYIDKTHTFYEKHGPKTIIIARFVPIVRTFAPFVAGIGEMSYGKFFRFNLIGGFSWVVGLTLLGYFFGGLEIVQENFETVIFGIILISIIPIIIEFIRNKAASKKTGK